MKAESISSFLFLLGSNDVLGVAYTRHPHLLLELARLLVAIVYQMRDLSFFVFDEGEHDLRVKVPDKEFEFRFRK
jgi:hypothetical protein